MSRFLLTAMLMFCFSLLSISQEKKEPTNADTFKQEKAEQLEKMRIEFQKVIDSGDPKRIEDLEKMRIKYLEVRDITGEMPALFEHLRKRMFDGVAKSKTVTIYEGLPHQMNEDELLEKERITKKTIKLHGFDFYADPITPNEKDAQTLLKLCQTEKLFHRYEGKKLCGAYHPDWCIEFKNGDEVYRFNFCGGCAASRLYGPKNDLYAELRADDELWGLLKTYQKNRPKKAK